MTGRQGFPFRGRWHGEAMTDEVPLPGELAQPQAVTERSCLPLEGKVAERSEVG